ncbi:hypothetical protein PYJP_04480 [Pyrofollis japonicus]|uniref:6-pyruvoyl trahydropterin synthase family protein n=1 Tax=Pyrofollis japonicus TaxID=3060460 RepID=UPI00295B245A|nr:6-carboxytetrahydropterin synthase [Pyrofollis japonicus]BEP17096.1 hypothetical protein PYJP_04480 [Pyrofollis japonicus]
MYGVCVSKWVSVALRLSSPYLQGSPLHGHDYKVKVCVEGPLGSDNKVIDHLELLALLDECLRDINYKYLNDVLGVENPTAELMTSHIASCISTRLKRDGLRIVLVEACTPSDLCSYYKPLSQHK